MIITNETPTGTINGVNTTFTTAQGIAGVFSVMVDGAVYGGSITFTGTTITLGIPPVYSVSITYLPAGSGTGFYSNLSAQELYDEFLLYKRNLTGTSQALFTQWLKRVENKIWNLILSQDNSDFISSVDITASNTPVDLPSAFQDIRPMGCGIYAQNCKDPLVQTSFNSNQRGYYLQTGKIYFTGFNNPETVTLRYIPLRAQTVLSSPSTGETEFMLLSSRWLDLYLHALDVNYCEEYKDPAENNARQRYTQDEADFIKYFDKTPNIAYVGNPLI